jgi:hypothetical protein
MNLNRVLEERIKPELNFLYTAHPFETEGGQDFGWYCKEHAFHCYFLCKVLGIQANIKRGHVCIRNHKGELILSTFGETCDHAWLKMAEECPVDLSLTLKHLRPEMPPIDLVKGQERRGEYQVTYAVGSCTEGKSGPSSTNTIHYCEKEEVSIPALDLLKNPFLFLSKPEKNGLTDVLGNDILDRVTVHLVRVARGEINPLVGYISDVPRAFKLIKDRNQDASGKLREWVAS